jgi:hypothetical protein
MATRPRADAPDNARRGVACSVLIIREMSVTVVPQPLVPRLVGRLLVLLVNSVEGVRSRLHRPIAH